MKTLAISAVAFSLLSSPSWAAARGEEHALSCSSTSKNVTHQLKLLLREGAVAHITYESVNNKNGDTCQISAGDASQVDSKGSRWESWQDVTLIHFKDAAAQASHEEPIMLILKQPTSYRITVNGSFQNYCGLHGYLAATAVISVGSSKCMLKW